MEKKSIARENYLRLICELDEGKGVRSVDIARKLKISKASVSEMLRKLARENLIKIKPYSKIFLTAKGKRKAEMFYNKHYVIKNFLKKILKYKEEKAKEEAHELEHSLSDESVEIIERLMEGKSFEEPKETEKLFKPLPSYIS